MAVVAMIGLSSCSKEKDCQCTAKIGNISYDLGVEHIEDGECSDLETTITGYSLVECKEL